MQALFYWTWVISVFHVLLFSLIARRWVERWPLNLPVLVTSAASMVVTATACSLGNQCVETRALTVSVVVSASPW